MTKDVIKGKRVIFRPKSGDVDATPCLNALMATGKWVTVSDCIRNVLISYCEAAEIA